MGEPDIGTQLFIQYQAAMKQRALRYVSNIHDAEDIVSDCWISLIHHFPLLSSMDERRRSAYILTAVQNAAIDYLRKRRHSCNLIQSKNDHPMEASSDFIDSVMDRDIVKSILKRLPPREAKVAMYKLCSYDDSEIAELLEICQSSVRVYWLRSKKRMKMMYESGIFLGQ